MSDTTLSPLDAANLLAGQAVAAATAFLDGRSDARRLALDASRLEAQSLGFSDQFSSGLLQGVRMLIVACKAIAAADREIEADGAGLILREKWEMVAGQLVELIRHQSRMLLERGQ
ncbi:hypothetical protein [Bradyrhizobium sp. SZCCHNRI2049]|uniref:hypothetical protein n=1 Tax=Bradyrhizobium sp. SZCCHNRI2049 TaxID=3057287 RepID=UPI0029163DE8|nr:hypothetical protein [Bradyrhizobium sp. SZCCHNRI2049]